MRYILKFLVLMITAIIGALASHLSGYLDDIFEECPSFFSFCSVKIFWNSDSFIPVAILSLIVLLVEIYLDIQYTKKEIREIADDYESQIQEIYDSREYQRGKSEIEYDDELRKIEQMMEREKRYDDYEKIKARRNPISMETIINWMFGK